MYEENSYMCPLADRDMWDAECYDVQMVRYGFIKPVVLDFVFDKSVATQMCENCSFNQLNRSVPAVKKQTTA